MAFTLFLLGTDTQYSPFAVDNAYDKAETLSYLSQFISGEKCQTDTILQYHNAHCAVIDGPSTLGSEVGDRIARGLGAVLQAISRGETTINLIGHSRGAVEANLLAHELERIQTILQTQPTDLNKILSSVCPYTFNALNHNHTQLFKDIDLTKVAECIPNLKVALFTLDPVPGGQFLGVTIGTNLAWHDPRFYLVSSVVTTYKQIILANERTRCFKVVVPKCQSPDTLFELERLPGHHGTGSGNLKDQQRQDGIIGKTVEHVQQLILLKLYSFLKQHDVHFSTDQMSADPFTGLLTNFIHGDKSVVMNDKLLSLYELIKQNKDAYDHFNTTSYATLGQEQGFWDWLGRKIDQRMVHYQGHNDTFLDSIIPPVPGSYFINYEHARLHLHKALGINNNELPLSDMIDDVIDHLITTCKHKKQLIDGGPLTASTLENDIVHTLDTKEGKSNFASGLSLLISQIQQSYLQKSDNAAQLNAVLFNAFMKFKKFAECNISNVLAQEILSQFNQGFKETLQTRYSDLLNQRKLILKLFETENLISLMQKQSAQLVSTFNTLSHAEDVTLKNDVVAFDNNFQIFLQSAPDVIQIKTFLIQQLDDFNKRIGAQTHNNQFQTLITLINEMAQDVENYESENVIREAKRICEEIADFKESFPTFRELFAELDYQDWADDLDEKMIFLIHKSADFIIKKDLLSQDFIQQINHNPHFANVLIPLLINKKNASAKALFDDTTELKCQLIIKNNLILFCDAYLKHITDEIKKTVDPDLLVSEDGITVSGAIAWHDNDHALQLKAKYDALIVLEHTLKNPETEKPSTKIIQFYNQLTQFDAQISAHRDKAWKRFMLNTGKVLGIIVTGIIPGLIVLALSSALWGKTPKFWQSAGQTFFKKSLGEVSNAGLNLPKLGA